MNVSNRFTVPLVYPFTLPPLPFSPLYLPAQTLEATLLSRLAHLLSLQGGNAPDVPDTTAHSADTARQHHGAPPTAETLDSVGHLTLRLALAGAEDVAVRREHSGWLVRAEARLLRHRLSQLSATTPADIAAAKEVVVASSVPLQLWQGGGYWDALGRWKEGWRCTCDDAPHVLQTVATKLCTAAPPVPPPPPRQQPRNGPGTVHPGSGGASTAHRRGGAAAGGNARAAYKPSPLARSATTAAGPPVYLRLPFEACTLFVAQRDPAAIISLGHVYLPSMLWTALILERYVGNPSYRKTVLEDGD